MVRSKILQSLEINLPLAPKDVIISNEDELYESYLVAKQQLAAGRGIPSNIVISELEAKYDV